MTKPNKSQLVIELEKNLSSQDYSYSNQLDSATTVDVMANIRRLPVKDVSTFSWFAKKFFSSIQKYMSIGRCNFVFDIYDDRPSAEDCERMRRQNVHPINLSEIDDNTPIPKDISTFWPSKSNKMLREKYLYNTLCKKESPYPIVIGQVAHDEDRWKCVIQHKLLVRLHMISQPYLEEADSQIVLYVLDSIKSGHHINVVLSNDTDVVILLLYYMPAFIEHGLKELWLRGGIGDKTRFIPIHTLFEKVGKDLCSVLPALVRLVRRKQHYLQIRKNIFVLSEKTPPYRQKK